MSLSLTRKKKPGQAECTEGCNRERAIFLWRIEGGEGSMEATTCCSRMGVLLTSDQEIATVTIRSLGRESPGLKVGVGC
jgi:hypothetical protein